MVLILDLEFGFCLGVLSFSMGLGFCLSLGLTLGSGWCWVDRWWGFSGDLWLLWLVVWVIVVVVLVVGGGFSLWVWIFCAKIDFEWVSQLGLS